MKRLVRRKEEVLSKKGGKMKILIRRGTDIQVRFGGAALQREGQ